jgi:hypothetical protein
MPTAAFSPGVATRRLLKPDRIDSAPPISGLPISHNEIWMDADENRRGRRSLSPTVIYLSLRRVFRLLNPTAAQAINLERLKSVRR